MGDQTTTTQVGPIKNINIFVHGIPYVVISIVLHKKKYGL
jgi:hypothetical protein